MASPGHGIRDFAFVKLEDPDLMIGKVGLWQETSQSEMEIGIILNRNEWGKGYANEALSAFLEYYWGLEEAKNVTALTADVDPRNDASLKLLKRAGFKETGYKEKTFQTQLGWCDSVYLKLDRGEAL